MVLAANSDVAASVSFDALDMVGRRCLNVRVAWEANEMQGLNRGLSKLW